MSESWRSVDESSLSWIAQASTAFSVTGYDVGGLPDSIFVLHPIYERVDGQPEPMDADERAGGDPVTGWIGPLSSAYRLVKWREYARRRGTELVDLNQWPFNNARDGVDSEPTIIGPNEGSIDNLTVWHALTTVLTQYSPDGPDTRCTAYYISVATYDPFRGQAPCVYRGRLGDVDDLIASPQVNYMSPQNLWPDDHSWVLYSDFDLCYTKISGSRELIGAVAEHPDLETLHPARS